MINGAHVLVYSKDPDADRVFFRDVLKFPFVDVGHEILGSVLYLMCDDLQQTVASLAAKNVACTEIETEDWGIRTTIRLPSGGEIGLYQPTHATALGLGRSGA